MNVGGTYLDLDEVDLVMAGIGVAKIISKEKDKRIAELENDVLRLTNENKILKEGKTNVFAELNDETAKSNEMLMAKVADLENENKGLKAERPQWHYLVEDPNDLPKKEGPYWVCVRDGRYKEDGSWEWTSKPLCKTGVWRDGIFGKAGGPPVIAWCEIPTFDKE